MWKKGNRFLDKGIHPKIRGRYLNAYVRSRLCYNAATWSCGKTAIHDLEVVWSRLLCRCVKGGFRLCDKEDSSGKRPMVYKTSQIHYILGTSSIEDFIQQQRLHWIAHCARIPNSCLQKQTLFMVSYEKSYWYMDKVGVGNRNR